MTPEKACSDTKIFLAASGGLQSKRPQVKTPPSQNVTELVKTSPKNWSKRPHGKKCWSKRPQNDFFILFFYVISGIIWDV